MRTGLRSRKHVLRLARPACVALAVGLWFAAPVPPAHAHTCGTAAPTDCAANRDTTCKVACDENDLRDAVDVVNQCGGHRTIRFQFGGCNSSCTIAMQNTSSKATCSTNANAVCVTGDQVTLDGANATGQTGVTFVYAGPYKCASCNNPALKGACAGPQPGLLVLHGSNDTVQNVAMSLFPKGIRADGPSSDAVANVQSSYYCGEAITIYNGNAHSIHDCTLTGATDPVAGHTGGHCWQERGAVACTTDADCHGTCSASGANCAVAGDCSAGETCVAIGSQHCHCANGTFAGESPNGGSCAPAGSGTCFREALCGVDEAVEVVNGTGHAIYDNSFTNPEWGVNVCPDDQDTAAADVHDNVVTGSQVDLALSADPSFTLSKDDVCDGMMAEGAPGATAIATFENNRVKFCRWGIQSSQGAVVHATHNTIKNDYVSGFAARGASTLTGSFNRMKNNGTLPTAPGDAQRGGVVVVNDYTGPHVDFGSRAAGGERGLNVFCGSLPSISDHIPFCPAFTCCGVALTAERNCFETGTPIDDPYGRVDLTDDARIGADSLCADYNLQCDF